ncbi:hypothetical protein [Methylobacterium komagatae]|uniref:hypothetical protein n=1 Tax=Methylobacterium komagatae TaxID=374425 RepID=UPI0036726B6A
MDVIPTESATAPAASQFFIIMLVLPKVSGFRPAFGNTVPVISAMGGRRSVTAERPHGAAPSQRLGLFYKDLRKDSAMLAGLAHPDQPLRKSRIFAAAQHKCGTGRSAK